MTVDVAGLVRDRRLDLRDVFRDAEWRHSDDSILATFAVWDIRSDCVDDMRTANIWLEQATAYGITGYRWSLPDEDGDEIVSGTPTLDRDAAIAGGKEYALRHDVRFKNMGEGISGRTAMTHAVTVDLADLIDAGVLDLEDVFLNAEWEEEDDARITFWDFDPYSYGSADQVEIYVCVESAECFGIVGYRWAVPAREIGYVHKGPPVLEMATAVAGAREYAAKHDVGPPPAGGAHQCG